MKKTIYSSHAPKPIGPYNQAIQAGGFLFISGQIPIDPEANKVIEGDISVQTKKALDNIKNILVKAGYTFEDVIYVTVYLTDIRDYREFNEIYSKYFNRDYPARVVVEVSKLPKDVKIEITTIAYKNRIVASK